MIGEGITATWTIRVLKRAGFQVNQKKNSLPISVEVISNYKQVLWKITNSQIVYTYHSLYEMIEFLNYL